MTITRTEAQALATFVSRARADWDHAGIVAAVMRASSLGSPLAIGAALCRLAENGELRTPALLAEPGAHWSGTTVAARKPPTMCGLHLTERALNCRGCQDETVPAPAGWRDRATRCARCDGLGYYDERLSDDEPPAAVHCKACNGNGWIEAA